MKTVLLGLAAASAGLLAGTASAGAITFFGEDLHNSDTMPLPVASRVNSTNASNQFRSMLMDEHIVSFEPGEGFVANPTFVPGPMPGDVGVNPNVAFPNGVNASITGGIVRFQAAGTAGPPAPFGPEGRYPTTGVHYLSANTQNLVLTFDSPQVAFGFWGVDVGDFGGTLTLTLAGGGLMPINISPNSSGGAASGSVLFWGVIAADNPFTGVMFSNNTGSDIFAFDDFTIGDLEMLVMIPLPTAMNLGLAGFVGLGGLAATRRVRRA